MENKILRLLGQEDYAPSNVPELLSQLGLRRNQQQELQGVLKDMERAGLILRTKGNRYIQSSGADLIPGTIQITKQGRGFVQPDEPGMSEIAIAAEATSVALHGDRVLVRLDVRPVGPKSKPAEGNTGRVVRILERKRARFVGTLQQSRQFLYVVPDDPRIPNNICVPPPRDVGRAANPGDKVVVELIAWENRHTPPEGEVIEVLGPPGEEGVDMLSVLRHYDLPLHFPKEVLAEANEIAKSRPDNQPSEQECQGREDCRGHLVITIDPDDAKDFDDAICIERSGKDRWKMWVHIADVSHYVRPGTQLDREARKRGNSTYLVDRVIPMLPEALSNELCSLKPGVNRLTKCVEFLLSNEGKVIRSRFYPAVIHSKRRFSYQEAFKLLQQAPKNEIETMLHDAHAMAQRIRAERFRKGSLDLDFPENKIRLDAQGKVIRIERMENDVSHQLIEEYMLLANEAVAGELMRRNVPAIYRVHEAPKDKRLQEYRDDVLSHRVACGNLTVRSEVQKLLKLLGTLPIGPALKIGFLRSLMRARYAVEPLGHYGLAKTQYAHFTSPIRRYADLVVHRALFDKKPSNVAAIKQISDHITETERNSSDAERDSKEVKLYAYLQGQLDSGELVTYPALVTDLRNFGFFVDVPEVGVNGVVPLSSIQDDFFVMDPARNCLLGRHTGRQIRLGDRVKVQIYRIDKFKKQVDYQLVPAEAEREKARPSEGRPGKKGYGGKGFLAKQKQAKAERSQKKQRFSDSAGPRDKGPTGGKGAPAPQGKGSAPHGKGSKSHGKGPKPQGRGPATQGRGAAAQGKGQSHPAAKSAPTRPTGKNDGAKRGKR